MAGFNACKKEGKPQRVYLDKPFTVDNRTPFFLYDTVRYRHNGTVTDSVYCVSGKITSYKDERNHGAACSNAWPQPIEVWTKLTVNSHDSLPCKQLMPGCLTENDEWNPYLNNNAPRCVVYDSLHLCLLKVSPAEMNPKNDKEYRVKYVFKRPK